MGGQPRETLARRPQAHPRSGAQSPAPDGLARCWLCSRLSGNTLSAPSSYPSETGTHCVGSSTPPELTGGRLRTLQAWVLPQQKATLTFKSIASRPRLPAALHALLRGHGASRAPQAQLCLLLRPSGLTPASQWCHREPRLRGVWPLLMDERTLWATFPQSQTCATSATSQG